MFAHLKVYVNIFCVTGNLNYWLFRGKKRRLFFCSTWWIILYVSFHLFSVVLVDWVMLWPWCKDDKACILPNETYSISVLSLLSCLHTKFSFPSLQFACAFCSLSIFQSCFPAFFFLLIFSFCIPHSYPAMVSEWAKFGTYAPTLLPAWTFGTFWRNDEKNETKRQHVSVVH